jgi:hypothetical protein
MKKKQKQAKTFDWRELDDGTFEAEKKLQGCAVVLRVDDTRDSAKTTSVHWWAEARRQTGPYYANVERGGVEETVDDAKTAAEDWAEHVARLARVCARD